MFRQTVKTAARIALYLAAVIAVSGFLTFSLLFIPPVQKQVINMITARLGSAVTGTLSIGSITSNLFSSLKLHDIRIVDPSDTTLYIEVGHLQVNYLLPLLIRRHLAVSSLKINKIHLSCRIARDGTFRFPAVPVQENEKPRPADMKSEKEAWRFSCGSIKISNISGVFSDSANHQTAVVNNASIAATIPSLDSITIRCTSATGRYSSGWWTGEIQRLDCTTLFTPGRIMITRLKVNTPDTRLTGGGVVPLSTDGTWDVKVTAAADVAAIPALFNNIPEFEPLGRIAVNASWTGTLKKPLLTLDLDAYSIEYKGVTIDTLSVTAGYDTLSLCKGTLNAANKAGTAAITVAGEVNNLFSSPEIGTYVIDASLKSIYPEAVRPLKRLVPEPLSGMKLNCRVDVGGKGSSSLPDSIKLSGSLSVPRISEDSIRIKSHFHDSTVEVSAMLAGNRCEGYCNFHNDNTLHGVFSAAFSNLTSVTSPYSSDSVAGTLFARMVCDGTVQQPDFKIIINGKDVTWREVTVDTLTGILRFNGPAAVLDSCLVRAHCTIDSLLEPFADIDGLRGKLSFDLRAGGPLSAPDITGELAGTSIGYRTFAVDSTRLTFSIRSADTVVLSSGWLLLHETSLPLRCNGEVVLSSKAGWADAVVEPTPHGIMEKTGKIHIEGRWGSDSTFAVLHIYNMPLVIVSPFLPDKKVTNGTVSAVADFSGANNNPLINIDMTSNKPGFDFLSLQAGTFKARLQDSLLSASGKIILGENKDSITLSVLIPFLPSSSWKIDTLHERACSLAVAATNFPLAFASEFLDSTWKLGGRVTLEVNGYLSERQLLLDGNAGVTGGHVENRNRQILLQSLSVNSRISGPMSKPAAEFQVSSGPSVFYEIPVEKITGRGKVSPAAVELSSFAIDFADSGKIAIQGILPFSSLDTSGTENGDAAQISFTVLRLPLKLAAPLVNGIAIRKGSIEGTGNISLQSGQPVVTGNVSLANGFASIDDVEPPVGPVSLNVRLAGDSIRIEELSAAWGKGKAEAEGSCVLRNDSLPVIDARCTVENLGWSIPDAAEMAVERAELTCSTVNNRYLIGGRCTAGPCRYTQDIQISDLLDQLQGSPLQSGSGRQQFFPSSLGSSVDLDVAVDLRDNIVIDINLGFLKIDGICRLTGVLSSPSYTGELRVSEGNVYYLDRRFTIDHATLSNYNPRQLNPRIDLEATADVTAVSGGLMETYIIMLSVTGDLEHPVVILREKSGALSQLEIVSILTFGQTSGGMSGDVKDRLRTFVGQSVLGFGTRKLEQLLGIEKLDVQGDFLGGKNAVASSRVSIAKRITPRLLVLYESEIGNLRKPKISALYRITNNLFLSGERTSEGNSGVDLIFKYSR